MAIKENCTNPNQKYNLTKVFTCIASSSVLHIKWTVLVILSL